MNRKALTALFATLAVGGCTLAPDYQQPESPVPAAAVVAETMAAIVVARELQRKFGGDTVDEMVGALDAYRKRLAAF